MQTSGQIPYLNLKQSPRKASAAGKQRTTGGTTGVTSRASAPRNVHARRELARKRAKAT